jgi:predicted MPP superfamily phosphohydrolase/VanZ family protein
MKRRRILSWIATAAWMAFIFFMSHQTANESNELSVGLSEKIITVLKSLYPSIQEDGFPLNHYVRKSAHFFTYMVLGILTCNALLIGKRNEKKAYIQGLIICVLYAVSDEIHQLFVPGRGGQVKDVLLDSAGSLTSLFVYGGFRRLKDRIRLSEKAKKRLKKFSYFGLILLLVLFVYIQNYTLTVSEFSIPSPVDKPVRLVHLSDLHNQTFGKDNGRLIRRIDRLDPDIIVFTGDLIDRKTVNLEACLRTMKMLAEMAPVYFVPGNHEYWSPLTKELFEGLKNSGVTVLSNETVEVEIRGNVLEIIGIDFGANQAYDFDDTGTSSYCILLNHYPEDFWRFKGKGVHLVLSGHAHGGQFRLPFGGGLYAPGQGFFPYYDSGIFQEDNMYMIVSRGLGNSVIPLRIFNRPEIVYVVLKPDSA